jgi:hypothetical protein
MPKKWWNRHPRNEVRHPMRFRFTIRDLLWLTLVVAMAVGWWLDHRRWQSRCEKAESDARTRTNEADRVRSVLWQIRDSQPSEQKRILDVTGFGSHLERGHGYDTVKTLTEAVQLAQSQLLQDGKSEYVSLLSDDRIRAAIHAAIKSYGSKIDALEHRFPGTKDQWEQLKPVYLRIADDGEWPAGTVFKADYGYSDNAADYEGLLLRLNIALPTDNRRQFGLPILDLYFGRFGD